MALHVSTGLRDQMLDTGSFKSIMDLGFINIYAGVEPTDANNAIGSAGSNVLVCTISIDGLGTGLSMDTAASGVLSKIAIDSWKGTNLASGTANFYRHVGSADDGLLSTTQPRMQGTIDIANAEMNFTSTTLSIGAEQLIDFYSVTFPSL